MSGENILVLGASLLMLEAGGAALANGAINVTASAAYDLSANGWYPDAEFVLTCTFASAPTDRSVITLVAQPLAIDGAKNAPVPTAARLDKTIGNFVVPGITGERSMSLVAYDIPVNAVYYLYNNSTGQSISAGWTLKVRPRTIKAAP